MRLAQALVAWEIPNPYRARLGLPWPRVMRIMITRVIITAENMLARIPRLSVTAKPRIFSMNWFSK